MSPDHSEREYAERSGESGRQDCAKHERYEGGNAGHGRHAEEGTRMNTQHERDGAGRYAGRCQHKGGQAAGVAHWKGAERSQDDGGDESDEEQREWGEAARHQWLKQERAGEWTEGSEESLDCGVVTVKRGGSSYDEQRQEMASAGQMDLYETKGCAIVRGA